MNLSTADLRNYRTEFHETWWSYRYMILVGPKVFSFVVKGVKVIFRGLHMWVDYDVPNLFPTLKNVYRLPFSKWPPQYRTNSTLSDFNNISYVGRL